MRASLIVPYVAVTGFAAGQSLTTVAALLAPITTHRLGATLTVAIITVVLCALAIACGWYVRLALDPGFAPSVYRTGATVLNAVVVCAALTLLPSARHDVVWEVGLTVAMLLGALHAGLRARPADDSEGITPPLSDNYLWSGAILIGTLSLLGLPQFGVVVQNTAAGLLLTTLVAAGTSTGILASRGVRRTRELLPAKKGPARHAPTPLRQRG